MGAPLVIYESRLEDATPVASTTAAGDFDVKNLRDFRAYTFWKPTAIPATVTVDSGSSKSFDYLLIWGHDLNTQGNTVELRKSNDNFAGDDNLVVTNTPSNDDPFILQFTSDSERYTRLKITGGTAPTIAIAAWGDRLTMPGNIQPGFDPVGRTIRGQQNRSIKGHPLGKVIEYEEFKQNVRIPLVTWSFLRATWLPAWKAHLRSSPFVFAWDPENHADELFLCNSAGGFSSDHRPGSLADLDIELVGRFE